MEKNLIGFLKDIRVPVSYYGMKSLIRRYFIMTVFDMNSCLKVSVNIEGSVCIEFRKEKRVHDIIWNCIYQNEDEEIILWTVEKDQNSTYYGEPVVHEDEIATLLHDISQEGSVGEFDCSEA